MYFNIKLIIFVFFLCVVPLINNCYGQSGNPQILLINLGNSNSIPHSKDQLKLDSLLKTLPKGNDIFFLGIKKQTEQYAFFSNARVAQIFPPNIYDDLLLKLKVIYPQFRSQIVDYASNLNSIEKP